MDTIYVAIDVETTGLDTGVDEIIEVAAVKFREDAVLETFSQLVKPRHSVPLKIQRLTGITEEDLAHAPRFRDVAPQFVRFLKSYPLVGHSVGFDIGMLSAAGMHFTQPAYDTFDMATLLLPQVSTYKLATLAEYLQLAHAEHHRALHDADVCRQVFLKLLEQIRALDLPSLTAINRLMTRTSWPLRDLFEEIGHHRLRGAWNEPAPATRTPRHRTPAQAPLLEGDAGWMVKPFPPIEPPLKPTNNTYPLDPALIEAFFSPTGMLSRALPAYEQRTPQVEMARAVLYAFNEHGNAMIEAGTGTGKSMAYLVPAVLFAVQRGERVVISTNTINLQDQLFWKDIPDLQRILALTQQPTAAAPTASGSTGDNGGSSSPAFQPFKAALLKGRSNYLCLRRYNGLHPDQDDDVASLKPDEASALIKVKLWLTTTSSGDRNELRLMEGERFAWERINVTTETCTGRRCEYFDQCFFFKARHTAEAAHIVVVNHALLLADLRTEQSVLPEYDHLIIDEAHNLEDVATGQLGFSTNHAALNEFFDKLYVTGGPETISGILSELEAFFAPAEQGVKQKAQQTYQEMTPQLDKARAASSDFFAHLRTFLRQEGGNNGKRQQESSYDERLRLTDATRQKPEWSAVQDSWESLHLLLDQIGSGLGTLETLIGEQKEKDLPGYDEMALQIHHLGMEVSDIRVQSGYIIHGQEDRICWLSRNPLHDTLTINAVPLNVGKILDAQLFSQKQTTVLTSATLSVNDSFTFVKERLGFSDLHEVQLDSPFDYEQQALVLIPTDILEPAQRGYQQMLEEVLIDIGIAAGGRTLALFTATSMLRQTYSAIQETLEEQGIVLLGQNIDGSRRLLLERFKENPRTMLFGTSSFWEGVDVVGDALSVLVIAKLPFNVPTDPVFAARSEQFKDPFSQYAIPQSVLRFKQGFGRLIRSRTDRGIVVVLDKRLITKKYGQQFLQSLPATNVRTAALKQLPGLVERFLGRAGG